MTKSLLTILFSLFSLLTFSQSSIEDLEKEKADIELKLFQLNDRLAQVKNQILKIESDKILENVKSEPILAIAPKGGFLIDLPSVAGGIILKFKEDTPIQVLDYIDEFYQVCAGNQCGYMSDVWVKSNPELQTFTRMMKERNKSEEHLAEIEKRKQTQLSLAEKKVEREKEDARMLKKYGKAQYDKMKKSLFWIGMNEEMLLFSLGEPSKKNTTGGSWGTHEQWIYPSGTYIYVDNGKVTSYQQ